MFIKPLGDTYDSRLSTIDKTYLGAIDELQAEKEPNLPATPALPENKFLNGNRQWSEIASTEKTVIIDNDMLAVRDATTTLFERMKWSNIKTAIKAYYDSVTTTLTNKTLTSPIINIIKTIADGTPIQFTKADGTTVLISLSTASGNMFHEVDSTALGGYYVRNKNTGVNASVNYLLSNEGNTSQIGFFGAGNNANTQVLAGLSRSALVYLFSNDANRDLFIGNFANKDVIFGTNNIVRGRIRNDGNWIIEGYVSMKRGLNVASATTITPSARLFHITGTTAIATINVPYSEFNGSITIIPDDTFTWTTAGNIALAGTAVVGKALIMTYDSTTSKWYPSY